MTLNVLPSGEFRLVPRMAATMVIGTVLGVFAGVVTAPGAKATEAPGTTAGATAANEGIANDEAATLGAITLQPLAVAPPVAARGWLQEVDLLISEAERARFLALAGDGEREAFIHLFWRRRDPTPFTPDNELRGRWTQRVRQARAWAAGAGVAGLSDPRAEAILMLGRPRRVFELPCTKPFGEFPIQPLEVWYYPSSRYRGPGEEPIYLVFLLPEPLEPLTEGDRAGVRMWSPTEGVAGLLFPRYRRRFDTHYVSLREIAASVDRGLCYRRHQPEFEALERALGAALSRAEVEQLADLPAPPAADGDGALPVAGGAMPATLRVAFPGVRDETVVVEARLDLSRRALATLPGREPLQHLIVSGELTTGATAHSHFLYRAYVSRARAENEELDAPLPFLFYRTLAPGRYTLALALEEVESGARFRDLYRLEVPDLLDPDANGRAGAHLPPPAGDRRATLLSEDRPALVLRRESLEILPPPPGLHLGKLAVRAVVTGEEVAALQWRLDGAPVAGGEAPPFTLDLDLGTVPRAHRLEAVALTADGRQVARDRIDLNAGPHRFRVRLVEPRPGERFPLIAPARVSVETPQGATLDRVDFYLDDTLVATSHTPPFLAEIPIPEAGRIGMVRAVAHLDDGRTADHGVLINTSEAVEEVEIDLVELYLSVRDGADKPVTDLQAEDFRVLEDGIEQTLSRFERVENLPIYAAVLMDTSESMAGRLERAGRAARRFFDTVVTAKDRAALLTFNHAHELVVPFTGDVARLAAGLRDLAPSGSTALYDSLANSLYYFGGLDGKRALILLTDGAEENSLVDYGGVLEYARRAGVAVYAIALRGAGAGHSGMARKSEALVARLTALAEQTGGRFYSLDSVDDLDPIYGAIERELRSQYLIAYQSSQGSSGPSFRRVQVEVRRPGVLANTQRGYYSD